MSTFPPGYAVNGTTWMCLSAILIAAVFFRFSRVWSLRNFDLLLLLSATPGLLLIERPETQTFGYVWMFVISGLYLVRLLVDPLLSRRPVLGQNLNAPGLAFLCISAFVLLTHAALVQQPSVSTRLAIEQPDQMVEDSATIPAGGQLLHGPAAPILAAPARMLPRQYAARGVAVLAHLAVAIGLLFAGRNLFNQTQLGLAMATLYLLLPATAIDVGAATHVLPAALIVWALVAYRKPLVAGTLMGLACGTLFFPLFLLPIWLAFYGKRGGLRFGTSVLVVAAVLATSLVLTTDDPNSFLRLTLGTIHFHVLQFERQDGFQGLWSGEWSGWFRVPVIAAYVVMLAMLTVWPRRKNLEHLITWSAAAIVGTQFWYPLEGGVYLLWYLPLLLMVVFRPRLVHLTPPEPPADEAAEPLSRKVAASQPAGSTSGVLRRAQLFR
jgi:hypothetical protein